MLDSVLSIWALCPGPTQEKKERLPGPVETAKTLYRHLSAWIAGVQKSRFIFFCWRLLGLIPGGAPFSQLNKGVKDAMVESTDLDECQFYDKKMQEGHNYLKNKRLHKERNRKKETIHRLGPGLQKRALVKSYTAPTPEQQKKRHR